MTNKLPGKMHTHHQDQVVVYDFDKTITTIDTLTSLIVFLINQSVARRCLAIPFLPVIYFLRHFKTTRRYAVSLGLWLASVGISQRGIINRVNLFASTNLNDRNNEIIRRNALLSIRRHLSEGHRVVIVSASAKLWIRKFLGSEITSRVTIVGSKLTFRWGGIVLKSWCYGDAKLSHLQQTYLNSHSIRTFYSDCTSDMALMQLAQNRCFINLPEKLQKILSAGDSYYFLKWQ